ncbi:MAG: nucleoside-diphosphate sugar epimerase/dehydratase, partial [Clostridiaceae bacterium]
TNYRKTVLFIADIIIVIGSFLSALLLKKEFMLQATDLIGFRSYIFIIAFIYVAAFILFGLYRNMWAYAGLNEYISLMYANIVAFFGTIIFDQVLETEFSISTIVIGAMIAFFFTEGIRIAYRIVINKKKPPLTMVEKERKNILIIGAGLAGKLLINEIKNNRNMRYDILGLIDDDVKKYGQSISGVSVVGTTEDIPKLVEDLNVHEVIFAIPSLTGEQKKRILNTINSTSVKMKTLPNISEIINKGLDINTIRDVEITDLLGRKEIEINKPEMLSYIEGKTVLVTGGGGSIGSELCRQISEYKPKKLIILDIYENNAYEIENELKANFKQLDLITLIASVRDRKKIFEIVKTYKPDIIFHAAAHKHVPLMETSPEEAIKNNVFGTLNMVQAANDFGVKRFILISTDKAVNPTNIMGATKRVCEMIIQTYDKISKSCDYVAVRFGNVLGSNGSVIPLFKKQIAQGGPVTVTHRDITRFFMTIPEAVQLVLTAGSMAKGGEIFVLDMGEPVKIYDLAKNLIRLSGLEPDVDIKIEVTGLRPGEKLYEELLMAEEGLTKTDNELIFIGKPHSFYWDELLPKLQSLRDVAIDENATRDEIKQEMAKIVETYKYQKTDL